ncbi:MAG: hypothetical protein R3C69_00085 [Geminicoccaceae bacterium]
MPDQLPGAQAAQHPRSGPDPETGDAAYLAATGPLVEAALDAFRPDLVFYNAGVDPHVDDRLGRLALTDQGLAARDALVLEACRRRATALAVVVGGGYALDVATVASPATPCSTRSRPGLDR